MTVTSESKFKGVDILLTSQWPLSPDRYGISLPTSSSASTVNGSSLISQLALYLKPRYHFAARENISYERQPYRNHQILQGDARHVTRFIALAHVGNTQKLKFLYACNVLPMKSMDVSELIKQPADVTECPYRFDRSLFKSIAKDEKAQQFFYDDKSVDRSTGRKRMSNDRYQQGEPRPKKSMEPVGPCWFCLASPEVEKHLVVSVGSHCYLALAKGGLTPDHILITPIEHIQSATAAPDDCLAEIEKYKEALKKCFQSRHCSMVFFERNYKTQHLQVQAVPIPQRQCSKLKETFIDCGLRQNVELAEIPKHSDLKQIVPAGAPYFYVELPDYSKLFFRISRGFPLQFGREALAHESVLNMPHKVDWRACKASKDEEVAMAASFRELFQKFDFT